MLPLYRTQWVKTGTIGCNTGAGLVARASLTLIHIIQWRSHKNPLRERGWRQLHIPITTSSVDSFGTHDSTGNVAARPLAHQWGRHKWSY